MKLSEVLKKDFPEKKHAGNPDDIDLLNEAWKEGYNTALTSCDREIDKEALAKELFEINQKKLYGDKGLSWEECLSINPESRFSSANDCREIANFIISTMPTWLRKVSEK